MSPISTSRTAFRFALCAGLYTSTYWLLWANLPVYLTDRGLRPHVVGSLISTQTLAALVTIIPIGVLSDRWSPRILCVMGATMLALCAGALLVPAAGTSPLLAAMLLGGMGSSLYVTSLHVLFFKTLGPGGRGRQVAIFLGGLLLGFSLGSLLTGLLYRPGVFASNAATAAASAGLLAAATLLLPSSEPLPVRVLDYLRDLRRGGALLVAALYFVASTHGGAEHIALPLLIEHGLRLSSTHMGIMFAIVGVWMTVIQALVGERVDRGGQPLTLFALGLVVSGVFQAASAHCSRYETLLAARLLHTVGDSSFMLANSVLVSMVFPRGRVGGSFGVLYALSMGAVSLSALAAGISNQLEQGYSAAFVGSGAVLVVAGVAALAGRWPLQRMLHAHTAHTADTADAADTAAATAATATTAAEARWPRSLAEDGRDVAGG
jgi:MFS family permease